MTNQEILKQNQSARSRCTVYTRVMGYHRPVETFNAGKQGEFQDRVHFKEPASVTLYHQPLSPQQPWQVPLILRPSHS